MRAFGHLFWATSLSCVPAAAQIAEPILTKTAMPAPTGAISLKLDYAGGIGQSGGGSQVIPEAILEAGASHGLELLLRFPLLRVTRPGGYAVIGGGQLATGARYLVAGGSTRAYAVAVQAVVEAPTGNTRIVGNATQAIPEALVDWRPARQVMFHSNIAFDDALGGTGPKVAFVEHSTSVVWLATTHVSPVFEFVGSTNTTTGRTQLVAQPEAILRQGSHLELKAGLSLGVNSHTPSVGLRSQVAWFWGRRE